MIDAMSREEKAARATGCARPALPSASMSYILARADAYDAIRADEKFAAWAGRVGGVDGVCLRGSWLHGLNHADSDCDLLVVGASVDDKVRAVNVHAGGVDALCVTAGRFAHLLAGADQVCVEARAYGGVLWRDGAVGRALVESVHVSLPLLVAHYRGQATRDRAVLASGRGELGRLVKLARNVVRQEACADSLAEHGALPIVSWGVWWRACVRWWIRAWWVLACWRAWSVWLAHLSSGGVLVCCRRSPARLCSMSLCGERHFSCGGVGVAHLVTCVLLLCLSGSLHRG